MRWEPNTLVYNCIIRLIEPPICTDEINSKPNVSGLVLTDLLTVVMQPRLVRLFKVVRLVRFVRLVMSGWLGWIIKYTSIRLHLKGNQLT